MSAAEQVGDDNPIGWPGQNPSEFAPAADGGAQGSGRVHPRITGLRDGRLVLMVQQTG